MRSTMTLLGTLVVASLLTVSTPAAHAAGGIGKPKVGACYNLTKSGFKQTTNDAKAVPCTGRHTSVTAGVPNLPAYLSYGSSDSSITAGSVQVCAKSFAAVVGGQYTQRALTRYQVKFFRPTRAQIRAGARWVRCDVVLRSSESIAALPKAPKPFLKGGVTKAMTRCGNQPSTTTITYLPCTGPHGYRATGAFKVAKKAYPSDSEFQSLIVKNCRKFIGSSRGYATIRDQLTWDTGDRTITCFKQTSS